MKYKSLRNIFVCIAALGFVHSAFSQELLNVTQWDRIGQVNVYGPDTVGIFTSDQLGTNTVSASDLSTFFGGVFLPGNGNGAATDGSGIKTTFDLTNGTTITFAGQVVTNEGIGTGWDRAFVFLDGKQYPLYTNTLAQTPGLSPLNKNVAGLTNATPIGVVTVIGLAPGVHTIGLGVYDTGDTDVTSGVLAISVPDPVAALDIAVEQREILLGVTATATRDVGGRLFMLRAGADEDDNGVTTLALADGGKSTSDGKDAKDTKEVKVAAPRPTVEFYGQGDYGYGDRNDISLADFVSNTYVGTAGVEVHLNNHLTLGLAYSHIENRTEFGNSIGKLRIRGDAITPYVSYARDHFYAEALYSYNKLDDQVNIGGPGGGQGTPSSENQTVRINMGYNLNFGKLVTGPFAALDYGSGGLDGFGAGGNTLVMSKQSYDSLITSLGWQASYKVQTGFGSVTPQLRASWDRENLDNGDTVSVGLPGVQTATLNAGTGVITPTGPFTGSANTIQSGRDYMNVGAGVLVNLGSRGSIIVDYEDHLFRSSYSERFASVQFGIKF